MARRSLRLLYALTTAAVLTACGGGGGGDATPPAPAPAPAPAADRATPLTLTPLNYMKTSFTTLALSEEMLTIGQTAVDHANHFTAPGGVLTYSEACINGGVVMLTLTDRDGNGRASAGDQVTATWRECAVPLVDRVLSGTATFELSAADSGAANVVRGTLDFDTGVTVTTRNPVYPESALLTGSMVVDWSRDTFQTSLSIVSTSRDDLRLASSANGKAVVDLIRQLAMSKVVGRDTARSVVSLAFRYDADSLGGSITVSSPTPLKAYLNTYPEVGLVTLAGANQRSVKITPNFVVDSDQYTMDFDDGVVVHRAMFRWQSTLPGFLWWDDMGQSTSMAPFLTSAFSNSGFTFSLAAPAPSVTPVFRLQFSRPPAAGTALTFRFVDLQGSQSVAGNATGSGALYVVTPAQQLAHGRSYSLVVVANGLDWTNGGTVRDDLGNAISTPNFSFQTPATLSAIAQSSGETLTTAGASVQLSATSSTSALGPIASYRWRQTSGTPLTISSPDSVTTQVSLPGNAPVGLENVPVELTVTDTAGETETTSIMVPILGASPGGRVLYFRSTAGDYIGGGKVSLTTDLTGTMSANPLNAGTVNYSYFPATEDRWMLTLSTSDGAPLQVGAYEQAVRAGFVSGRNGLDFSASSHGCNSVAGRYVVLEIATDASGTITKLAVDFEQHCEVASAPPLFGSLRINSSIAITP